MKDESLISLENPFPHDESSCTGRFTTDVSVEEAASLLQEIAHLASAEVGHVVDLLSADGLARRQMLSNCISTSETYPQKDSPALCERRLRTVSISSQSAQSPLCTPPVLGVVPSPLSPPPLTLFSPSRMATCNVPLLFAIQPTRTAPRHALRLPSLCNLSSALHHVHHSAPPSELQIEPSRRLTYVGTTTPEKLKGILRHKFSWKKHPEVRIHT